MKNDIDANPTHTTPSVLFDEKRIARSGQHRTREVKCAKDGATRERMEFFQAFCLNERIFFCVRITQEIWNLSCWRMTPHSSTSYCCWESRSGGSCSGLNLHLLRSKFVRLSILDLMYDFLANFVAAIYR